MAKPILKFDAVAFEVNGHTGYRPQLVQQNLVADLDFCREVVADKRLAMSPEELLHALEMVGEVGPRKVAEDGRPRAITKLLKWNRFAKGKLDSPTSPWNDSCKAVIRAQLLNDVEKQIDATFQNVNEGIGVRLNYVAWLGAKTVINVVKVGTAFAAYGNHMEWLEGDVATLRIGESEYPLACTDSDVAHAVFAWPEGLSPEAGTQAEFVMKSRGGVPDGQVYTSRKTVTIIAGDEPTMREKVRDAIAGIDRETGTIEEVVAACKAAGLCDDTAVDLESLCAQLGTPESVTTLEEFFAYYS